MFTVQTNGTVNWKNGDPVGKRLPNGPGCRVLFLARHRACLGTLAVVVVVVVVVIVVHSADLAARARATQT